MNVFPHHLDAIGHETTVPTDGPAKQSNFGEISNAHSNHTRVYYICPDSQIQSAGIRRLYRHVSMLSRNGFDAHILHMQNGFYRNDLNKVSVKHLDRIRFDTGDIVVIPEGCPAVMQALKDHPIRRFAIALNWDYVYKDLEPGKNWRSFNIERVITVSAPIAEMITWAMDLPTHLLSSSIDTNLYYVDPGAKRPHVAYIARKGHHAELLKRLIDLRISEISHDLKWIGLHSLSEAEYAKEIRKSAVFLNLSMAEGYPTSCLEAMASGTLVAGYASIGKGSLLRGDGSGQNCLLAPIGDYISLAQTLAPLLEEMAAGNMGRWNPILSNGIKTASGLTEEKEERSLIEFWQTVRSGQVEVMTTKESQSL